MGEATYYFKAIFSDEKSAKKAFPKIKEYLAEHEMAYEEWQRVRYGSSEGFENWKKRFGECKNCDERYKCLTDTAKKANACRIKYLKKTFPLAFSMIKINSKTFSDALNEISGELLDARELDMLERDGCEIRFHQTVWHFDNWEHFVKFVESLGGKAGYLSDEYIEPSDYYKLIEV